MLKVGYENIQSIKDLLIVNGESQNHFSVWSFNCVYLLNVFTNNIFNIYVKTRFGIK